MKNNVLPTASRRKTAKTVRPVPTSKLFVNQVKMNGFVANIKELPKGGLEFNLVNHDGSNKEALVLRCFLFPEVHGCPVHVPRAIMHNGAEIIILAQIRPNSFMERTGSVRKGMDFIVVAAIANDGISKFENE